MTTIYRYLQWDGTKNEFKLESQELFKEFSNFLMEGWTPDEAIEWIMKQGVHGKNIKIMGIDELRSELSKYKDKQFQTYNVQKSLSEIKKELDEIVEQELNSLKENLSRLSSEYQKRKNFLKNLPDRVSSAIEKLSGYDFIDAEAEERYEELRKKLEKIRKVENFLNRYGEKFRGKISLGFEETLDLIQELERIEQLEHSLMSGDFQEVTPEDFKRMTSEEGYNSFIILRDFKSAFEESGFIRIKERHVELTPKGIRKIGELALRDIFSSLKKHEFGGHETAQHGVGNIKPEDTKDYEFGDPFNLDVVGTLKNSLVRKSHGKGIKVAPEDFEVYDMEYHTRATTAVLLDLSWSMSFQGRFSAAKRVALALDHLIRMQYPRDNFYIIGFSTRARVLTPEQLATTSWDSNDPFTNIQEALMLASKLISKHKTPNKQIILITDGQPTAYFLDGYLQVELPMFFGGLSPRATFETLKEVKRSTRIGNTINTFMLDDSPSLRRFVDEMTRINKGRAFFTTPSQLGKYLFVDYLKRRKKML
ncbi:MAG TPA: VWA domain-containing protein [Thermodesulfobacteriota bacterium]|nr:VWA domain-containing protein [Thermodesulfobacteriota bacterium]